MSKRTFIELLFPFWKRKTIMTNKIKTYNFDTFTYSLQLFILKKSLNTKCVNVLLYVFHFCLCRCRWRRCDHRHCRFCCCCCCCFKETFTQNTCCAMTIVILNSSTITCKAFIIAQIEKRRQKFIPFQIVATLFHHRQKWMVWYMCGMLSRGWSRRTCTHKSTDTQPNYKQSLTKTPIHKLFLCFYLLKLSVCVNRQARENTTNNTIQTNQWKILANTSNALAPPLTPDVRWQPNVKTWKIRSMWNSEKKWTIAVAKSLIDNLHCSEMNWKQKQIEIFAHFKIKKKHYYLRWIVAVVAVAVVYFSLKFLCHSWRVYSKNGDRHTRETYIFDELAKCVLYF